MQTGEIKDVRQLRLCWLATWWGADKRQAGCCSYSRQEGQSLRAKQLELLTSVELFKGVPVSTFSVSDGGTPGGAMYLCCIEIKEDHFTSARKVFQCINLHKVRDYFIALMYYYYQFI